MIQILIQILKIHLLNFQAVRLLRVIWEMAAHLLKSLMVIIQVMMAELRLKSLMVIILVMMAQLLLICQAARAVIFQEAHRAVLLEAHRAVLRAVRPALAGMTPAQRRRVCGDIAANLGKPRRAGDARIYAGLAAARGASRDLSSLGQRIMASRNPCYKP
jgi:hypothetical protein